MPATLAPADQKRRSPSTALASSAPMHSTTFDTWLGHAIMFSECMVYKKLPKMQIG
jgi:hypothetical protein